jgi:penicillin-binding protein 1A
VAARRQPGSAFKPFVYLAAIENGLTPDTVREDKPIAIKGWKPENYAHEYYGPVTLTQALALSLNTVAVRLMQEVGAAAVAKAAYRLGIASKLDTNPSLALGTSEVSLIELVAAYAPFANGGSAIVPSVVERVRTTTGKTLYVRTLQDYGRVIEARHVAMMNAMMRETLRIGTAQRAQVAGWPAAGKTGTSQDFRDAWFVGYTSHLITGVWIGNDDSSPTRKATGSGLPVDIWSRVMKVAHQGVPVAVLPGTGMSFAAPSMQPAVNVAPPPAAFPPTVNSAPVASSATQMGAPAPPAPIGGRVQPQQPPPSSSGIDGWLVDRLFGRR